MSSPDRSPSVKKTAFECPHCGAFTTQKWYQVEARGIWHDTKLPFVVDQSLRDQFEHAKEMDSEKRSEFLATIDEALSGKITTQESSSGSPDYNIMSLHLSRCYECKDFAIWHLDRLIYPARKGGPLANQDLPAEVIADYNEARAILHASPRGAAALLRLSLEKLCKHLNAEGSNINQMIGDLVKKGLPTKIQKALDAVRVIGNEAVHPGEMDLKDDQQTALTLFNLVNIIADRMITQEKEIDDIYSMLPANKIEGINDRDKNAKN